MLSILYRDRDFVVCEKPVGILSESPGLPDMLRDQLHCSVFPVHRLDQGTGGVCILGLSPSVSSVLQRFFSEDLVCKEYLAVISGKPEDESGSYRDLLFHDRRSNKTFVAHNKRKGVKEAFCKWSVIGTTVFKGTVLSLVRVYLHTGRTHQIRVQFSSRKHPLVGDRRYGSRIKAEAPALWAYRISFPHPYTDGLQVTVSSLPKDLFPWTCFDLSDL